MKLFNALLCGAILAFLNACCAVQAHPFPDEMTWIKHCDEIPNEVTLASGGTLTFLDTIKCDTTKTIEITGSTIIRSHAALETMGITLLVRPGAHLTIKAPAINMQKSKSMSDQQPILRVLGSVDFQVTSWVKEHLDGTPVDSHGIVSVEGEGTVRSDKSIFFTPRSVIVVDPDAANKKETDPADISMPTDPDLLRKLAAMHANLASDSAAATTVKDISPKTSEPPPAAATAAAATVEQLAGDQSFSSATSPNRPPFSTAAAGPDDGDKSTAAATSDVPAPTSPAAPATPSSAANPNTSAREDVGNNPAAGAPMADSMTGRADELRDRGSTVNEDGLTGGGGGGASPFPESNSWTRKKGEPNQQHQQGQDDGKSNGTGDNNNHNNGHGNRNHNHHHNNNNNNSGNSGNGNSNRSSYTPPDQQFHPGFILKVGETLVGKLLNPARTSMLYASPTDGSVIHATANGKAPRDADGNTTGHVPQKKRVLLRANGGKMAKTLGLRSEIFAARMEKRKAALEGRELPRKGKVATLMGFLPFGKHGFRRRRAREHAEAHLGEATLSLTKTGNLEVDVDGSTVLRKSGPSWLFGFRRSDSSYELRVTEEGIVISRQGKFEWSVKAEDIF